jgi:hypothetical protein
MQARKHDRESGGGEVVGRPATELRTWAPRTVRFVGRLIRRSCDPILTLIRNERVGYRVGHRLPEGNCLNAPGPVA